MTIQTAVLIETLVALGAQVRWASLQHLLHPGPRRRGDRGRPGRHRRGPGRRAGLRLEGRDAARSTGGAPSRCCSGRTAQGPNMILDDGGDATLLVHKGAEFEAAGAVPPRRDRRLRGVRGHPRACCTARSAEDDQRWTRIAAGIKGVTEETTTGVHRLYEMQQARHAALPGDQRQRLGDQEQVRQQVRLPPLAHRRHQPGHRRADRRQGRGRLRLRRRGQGLRRVAARPGRPGHRHRGRPDLRAAGRDGRLPGRHPGRRRRARPTSSSPPPAASTSSPPSTWPG